MDYIRLAENGIQFVWAYFSLGFHLGRLSTFDGETLRLVTSMVSSKVASGPRYNPARAHSGYGDNPHLLDWGIRDEWKATRSGPLVRAQGSWYFWIRNWVEAWDSLGMMTVDRKSISCRKSNHRHLTVASVCDVRTEDMFTSEASWNFCAVCRA